MLLAFILIFIVLIVAADNEDAISLAFIALLLAAILH